MSSSAEGKYYGRKYKISVLAKGDSSDEDTVIEVSNSDFEPEALKVTFQIEKSGFQTPWHSTINIWNLASETQQKSIKEGMKVAVEAGYRNGPYGKIFSGDIFQPMFDRLNVTDFVTTLHCIDGMGLIYANLASITLQAGYNYNDVIAQMAKNATTPIPVGGITPKLDKKRMPRGKVIFGEPKKYLREIARDNDAQYWFGDGKLEISHIEDACEKDALVITPKTGLVGTPQQIENGVVFRTLLNPNLTVRRPLMTVKLDNSIIRQMKVQQGQTVSPLDKDGFYQVIRVTHLGDTRGNDWYTEIVGMNMVGNSPALLRMNTN